MMMFLELYTSALHFQIIMLYLEYCCDILAVCVIASYLRMIFNKGQMDCMPSAFGKTTELSLRE